MLEWMLDRLYLIPVRESIRRTLDCLLLFIFSRKQSKTQLKPLNGICRKSVLNTV